MTPRESLGAGVEWIRMRTTPAALGVLPRSPIGLLGVEEQQVAIATTTVHCWQYQDSVIPIHNMIRELESQGVVRNTCSLFNSPIRPVLKSNGEWRVTVDYCGLNKVTPSLSAAVPAMLELQYKLES
ncbi:hypothetical protein TURU_016962 [Turdus rufiventris]|nr:hypothetical protein TURU_016962 [Turdus rufiventris]